MCACDTSLLERRTFHLVLANLSRGLGRGGEVWMKGNEVSVRAAKAFR